MVRNMLLTAAMCAATALGAVGSKDTVTTDPAQPTARDSITFSLFNYTICCCAEYGNTSVEVTDSTITLAYAFDDAPCALCRCFAAGSMVSFTSGRLKAGAYRIYKLQDPCRLGAQICPAIMPMPVLVGRVTVRGTSEAKSPVVAYRSTVASANSIARTVDMRGRSVPHQSGIAAGVHFVKGYAGSLSVEVRN